MPYVMVPVPEEHVEAVMQFVLRAVAQAALQDWDTESLTKLWEDSDEATQNTACPYAPTARNVRRRSVLHRHPPCRFGAVQFPVSSRISKPP